MADPGHFEPASLHETHISVVALIGDRAYKLKKAVTTGFLDWSSREARLAGCRREVELNRRLAPDVYLGVADVLAPDGTVCDHLVVMRRMSEDRRLATLVAEGRPVSTCIRQIARVLADFHSRAERSADIDRAGSSAHLRSLWQSNFNEMNEFVGSILQPQPFEEAERLSLTYLDGREALLRRRVDDGRIVDGHGDLLAEDIWCYDAGPRILDCIEFNDLFRWGDVLADVGFLAMDLERLGAANMARELLDAYREFAAENHPATLEHHYIAYRALVRSKVACLRAAQGDVNAPALADRYLEQCVHHLERGHVRLVLVGGLPGTGKSSVAAGLANRFGWVLLRSDEVRKEITGLGHAARAGSRYGQGIYDTSTTAATYDELLRRARVALQLGECVIADASWTDPDQRLQAEAVARATHADLLELRCDAPTAVAAQRLLARIDDVSDATPSIAAQMAAELRPWPAARVLDTRRPFEQVLDEALRLVGEAARAGHGGAGPDSSTPSTSTSPADSA